MASTAKHGTLAAGTATVVQLDVWTAVRVYARTADIYATVPARYGAAPVDATVGGDDTFIVPANDPDGRVLPVPDYYPGENDQETGVRVSLISAGTAGYTVERA